MGRDFAIDQPDLQGVVAVVTGGGRGLGREFALELARCGAAVAVTGRSLGDLETTSGLIGEIGGRSALCVADVTDRRAVEEGAGRIEAALGAPTLLVNNAGQIDVAPFLRADPDAWWHVVEVNLRGTFNWTQVIVPRMPTSSIGRIVTFTSPAARSGPATTTSYNAAKAAISNLTATLAVELSEHITISFAPFGLTDMTRYLMGSDEIDEKLGERLRELFDARPEAVLTESMAMFRFLVSGEADRLSGRHIESFDSITELLAASQ